MDEDTKSRKPRGKPRGATLAILAVAALLLAGVAVGGVLQAANGGNPNVYIPPAKATLLARGTAEIATARAQDAGKAPPTYIPPTPQPSPTYVAGISQTPQGPFASITFQAYNSYLGPIGTKWYDAYAGENINADGSAGPGAVRVYTVDLNYVGDYIAPGPVGKLRIIGYSGVILQLHADSGQNLTFNIQTHQYTLVS